jgi:TolA-binding protein
MRAKDAARWFFLACCVGLFSLAIFASGCGKGLSERQLFEQAKKYQEEGKFTEAVAKYEELVKRYPRSSQAPQCLFMVGYLYANHMTDYEKARMAYETFVKKYPNDPLIKDAQWELTHLGQDVNHIRELNELLQRSADTLSNKTKQGSVQK